MRSCKVTIRQVARVIGQIVAICPRVVHGPLCYRNLEGRRGGLMVSVLDSGSSGSGPVLCS